MASQILERHNNAHMDSSISTNDSQVFRPELKYFAGHCQPSHYCEHLINDYHNHKLYLVGGFHRGHNPEAVVSDLFVCDTISMTWTNMANDLRIRNPYKPFSQEDRKPQLKRLPTLYSPGATLVRIENASFILIFGGYDYGKKEPSSKLIMIDPEEKEWWYLKFDGADIGARINPAMVAANNKMYIFGGHEKVGNDNRPCRSFSIAECKPEGVWHWEVRDAPISPSIPQGHMFGQAIPVYNGMKILLGPGTLTNKPSQFSKDQFFFYHTINKGFQPATADVTGIFPQDAVAYSMYEYHRPTSISPSIVLGVWIAKSEDHVPEIWRLLLSPDERIERLNIDQKLRDLKHNFTSLVCIEGRVLLLGAGPSDRQTAPANAPGDQHQMEVATDTAKSDTWCTYLDIPFDKL